MPALSEPSLFGAPLTQWLNALAMFAGVYLLLALVRRVVSQRLASVAARTTTRVDDVVAEMVRRTRGFFLFVLALQGAMRVVTPDERVGAVLHGLSVVLVLAQVGVWGNAIIGIGADQYARQRAAGDLGTRATIHAVGYAGRFVLWALLFITAVGSFGVNVSALITGLGIGGIAVALAAQNILGDLFAALAIMVDKPFVVGETIHVDNIIGTVEHVGLKTTRLRSLSGEQVIISNADLLRSRIRNYKRMQERRVVFHVDVSHRTPPEKMERIPAIAREAVQARQPTRFDRCHFLSWTDSAMRVEIVYSVLDPDYTKYADIQHAINIDLLRRFAAEDIEFAIATRPTPTPTSVQPVGDSTERREAHAST